MKDSGKKRLKQIILNGGGLVAPLIGALISVPILLRNMTPDAFGLLSMYWVLIGYASVFELGLGRSVTWQLASVENWESAETVGIVTTAVTMAIILGLAGAFFMALLMPLVFGSIITVAESLLHDNVISIWLMAFATPLLVLTSVLFGVLEARRSFGVISALRTPTGILMFLLPALISYMGGSLWEILSGIVIIRVILLVIALIVVSSAIKNSLISFNIDFLKMKRFISFGGWLTLSSIIGPILVYLDRFILTSKQNLDVTAVYTAAFEAVIRFLVIASAVTGVMFPRFVAASNQDQFVKKRLLFEASAYVFCGLLPIAMIFVFFGDRLFGIWLTGTQLDSSQINLVADLASVLAAGMVINGCAHVPQAFIQAHGFSRWTGLLHLLELFAFMLYAPLIIGQYGAFGAAYTWLIRAIISAVALYGLSIFLMHKRHQGVI